jgi:predicted dehydrogenase
MTRRQFLATAPAAVLAFSAVPRHVLGGPCYVAPSDRVHIAVIGAGGQGRYNTLWTLKEPDAQFVAVCDPYEQWDRGTGGRKSLQAEIQRLQSERGTPGECRDYADFRILLEREKGIDAIMCATPDHLHAVICIAAMKLGKHVYCEKPLTHNIWEARQVARVARETGVATQMGNMGHSGEGIRRTCEWLSAGVIGTVREVHAWGDGGRWITRSGRPPETPPVPASLDWDLWLGPRPMRPYHPDYTPSTWRGWWAFGGGNLGDMGCHNLDPAFWALHLDRPSAVQATSPGVDPEITCHCTMYYYSYGPRQGLPPLKVTWYDGGLRPPHPDGLDPEIPLEGGGNGIYFLGDKGVISCPGWGGAPRLLPHSLRESFQPPPLVLPRSKGHIRDWLDACKGGPPASSNFEYGARLTEMVLLGNVALRAGVKILWDADAMKAINAPEADAFLKGEYRSGWQIT